MKKSPIKWLVLVAVISLGWGTFLVPNTFASIVYLQPDLTVPFTILDNGGYDFTGADAARSYTNSFSIATGTQLSIGLLFFGTAFEGIYGVEVSHGTNVNSFVNACEFYWVMGTSTNSHAVGKNVYATSSLAVTHVIRALPDVGDSNCTWTGGSAFISYDPEASSPDSKVGKTVYTVGGKVNLVTQPVTYRYILNFSLISGQTGSTTSYAISVANEQVIASTTFQGMCGDSFSLSGAICNTVSWLFVPDVDAIQGFVTSGNYLFTTGLFSFVGQVSDAYSNQYASSSTNLPSYLVDLHSAGLGSTTAIGNFLPGSLSLLSSSTVNYYLPVGVHDLLYSFAEIAIAMTVTGYVFRRLLTVF